MALEEYVGAIVMEVDGQEIEVYLRHHHRQTQNNTTRMMMRRQPHQNNRTAHPECRHCRLLY